MEELDGFKFVWVKMPDYEDAHSKQRAINWFIFSWRIRKLNKFIKDKPDTISCRVLEEIMDSLDINQNIFGSRMHFLRFNIEITPIIAEKLVDYDSSLAFSEISGFRCGTCKEFSMFSVLERRKLDLRQVPLTNMECTIINKGSEELGYSLDSFNKFLYYKEIVEKYRGTYGLLWHNSSFSHKLDETFYLKLIK